MSAYCIFLCRTVHDRAKLARYWANVRSSMTGVSVQMLSSYQPFQILEGSDDALSGVVIAEFPSMEEAKSWHDSAAYADFKKLRLDGADFLTILAESGVAPVETRLLPKQ